MNRREKRIVKTVGTYRVVEIEFFSKETEEVIDTSYEVRKLEKFLVEFDNEREALLQLDYMLGLEEGNGPD